MSLSMSELYFFDQLKRRRKKKRYRKPPELLPFPLRLTGLSGAVRVEAYLKQQQQKSGDTPTDKENSRSPANPEPENDTHEANETPSRQGILESLNQSNKDTKVQDGEGNKRTRRTLNLPDIGISGFHTPPALRTRSLEHVEDEEDEDTQRFLFEENKFAAPNLLAQLGRLLEYIHERYVEELEEINSVRSQISTPVFRPTSGKSTFSVLAELEEEILSESFLIQGYAPILIPLPEDLHNKLLHNYDQLSCNAVYVKREWQTTSYREQALVQARLGIMNDSRVHVGESHKDKTDHKQHITSSHEIAKMEGDKLQAKERRKRGSLVPESDNSMKREESEQGFIANGTTSQLNMSGSRHDLESSHCLEILKSRRESRTLSSTGLSKPKTRLEKYKFYPDKDNHTGNKKRNSLGINRSSLVQQDIIDEEDIITLRDFSMKDSKDDVPPSQAGLPAGSPGTVINFSLLSKHCDEKGWIVYSRETDDLERQTLIEWARGRLMHVIKQKKEMEEKAKENGEDGSLIMKYYGDTKREAALKYKKGVAWAKRWKKLSEDEKRSKLLTQLPDGTAFCYYPSGRVAVCNTNPGTKIPGKYTFVYGDSPDRPMMASFTTIGCGCCYYPDGTIRFISTPKYGYVFEKDGSQNKKWKWPLGKLQVAVQFQLNSFISFRCLSQSSMTLYFNCQNETAKFPVGVTQGAKAVKIQELGYLQTDVKFISLAAQQATKPKPTRRKEGRRRRGKRVPVDVITEEVIEQRQQELEEKFPERKDIDVDTPCQLELNKLQRKVKNIVFDWMEHYRISVGITSPLRISSQPRRRSQSQSARSTPGTLPSSRGTGAGRGRGTISRSPSAPPTPRTKAYIKFVDPTGSRSPTRPHSSAEIDALGKRDFEGLSRGLTLDVPTADQLAKRHTSKVVSAVSGPHTQSTVHSRPPFRCGVIQQENGPTSPPRSGCAIHRALRNHVVGEGDTQCRCDKRKVPVVTDLEYDEFIQEHVPRTQLLVVSVTSSMYPGANPCDGMLNQLYYERNRNRTFPCVQARNDPFRLVRYDIATAADHAQPLLMRRHNAVPGMFLMYLGGRLQFADHIFNGYGNAKRDFMKQIMQTRKDALEGKSLPADFRLSPTRGHSGMRSPWGGEIGGVKASYLVSSASPLPYSSAEDQPFARLLSAGNTESTESTMVDIRGGVHSAASFVKYGLSIDSPYPMSPARRRVHPQTMTPRRKIHTIA